MPLKRPTRIVLPGTAEVAKRIQAERKLALKQKITFVNDYVGANHSQDDIEALLKIRQPAVSEMNIVIEELGMGFVRLLDDKVQLRPLHAFACRCRSEKKSDTKPNTELRDEILASKKRVTKELLNRLKPTVIPPVPQWWVGLHLHNIGNDARFSRAHPTLAAMLNDITHYNSMGEWLAAHPATKMGVTKAKK